jgi:hypothetical protein
MSRIRRLLATVGAVLVSPGELNECLGTDDDAWRCFSAHWDEIVPEGVHRDGVTWSPRC